jgi:hypothetical protein
LAVPRCRSGYWCQRSASGGPIAIDVPGRRTAIEPSQRILLSNDRIGIEDPESLLEVVGGDVLPPIDLGCDCSETSLKRPIIAREHKKLNGG